MTSTAEEIQVVIFTVDEQPFAFEISQVERIMRYVAPTPLPRAAAFLEGVIPYAEDLVPVVDMRKRLSVVAEIDEECRLIILRVDEHPVAVLVDQVLDVHRVDVASINAPPKIVRGLAAQYIAGMLTRGDDTVVMLNAGKLFNSRERLQLDEAASSGRGENASQ
jgi:purine-binding chemotaxis protein CheW